MYETQYFRPASLAEALKLYETGEDPAYLAGGHTLIPTMKNRLAAPDRLIDVRGIPEMHGIDVADGRLSIGAATQHAVVARSSAVRETIPALALLAGSIGDVQVRHMGTIGGSLSNNDPSADYPSAVLGLGATLETDRRRIAADDFFAGLFATALEPGEILTRISFPVPMSAGYAKFRNPSSRYAMTAAFVARPDEKSVRVAITGASEQGVFRWSDAEKALAANFAPEAVSDLAVDAAGLLEDMHASRAYRANLVQVLTRRAVKSQGGAEIV